MKKIKGRLPDVKFPKPERSVAKFPRETRVVTGPLLGIYVCGVDASVDIDRLTVDDLGRLARSAIEAAKLVVETRRELISAAADAPARVLGTTSIDEDMLGLTKLAQQLNEPHTQRVNLSIPLTEKMVKLMQKIKGLDYLDAYMLAKANKKKGGK